MRRRLFVLTLLAVSLGASTPAQESTPAGRWRTIDDKTGEAKSIIRLSIDNGELTGVVEQVFAPPAPSTNPLCEKCDGALKNKPIVGMRVMWGFRKDGDKYSGGRLLDPESGNTYKGTITLTEAGQRLKLRGYVGFSMLGRTQTWKRE